MSASATYDAIVVGLGPAGSVAAYEMARTGRSVLALDRDRFPRYKVCGGALSARVDALLDGAHHATVERTVSSMTFCYNGQEAFTVGGREPIVSLVMRDRFDAALADRAARAGACLRFGESVVAVTETGEDVGVTTGRGTYRARFLVGADGAQGGVARRLNARPLRSVYGLEAEIDARDVPNELTLEMGAVPGGYGWTFPKRHGVSVGIGAFRDPEPRPKARFEQVASLHRRGDDQHQPLYTPRGHCIPVYAKEWCVASSRIGLVGDAARLVDPFFGEGIYYAILSGGELGRTIVGQLEQGTATLTPYTRWVENTLAPEFGVASWLASIAYTYPRVWYEAMRAHPDVIGWFYEVLRGTISFQDLGGRLRRNALRLAPAALLSRAAALLFR